LFAKHLGQPSRITVIIRSIKGARCGPKKNDGSVQNNA
jgi:hypothetical protein